MNKKEYEGKLAHDNTWYLFNMTIKNNNFKQKQAINIGREKEAAMKIFKKIVREQKIKKITKNIENF